ncbi:MAG: hypothetical protein K0R61_1770 [Microvirga sp.]|jgi:hypothetical protein|nr:hypothetical protein [Microvirga sp.]
MECKISRLVLHSARRHPAPSLGKLSAWVSRVTDRSPSLSIVRTSLLTDDSATRGAPITEGIVTTFPAGVVGIVLSTSRGFQRKGHRTCISRPDGVP